MKTKHGYSVDKLSPKDVKSLLKKKKKQKKNCILGENYIQSKNRQSRAGIFMIDTFALNSL